MSVVGYNSVITANNFTDIPEDLLRVYNGVIETVGLPKMPFRQWTTYNKELRGVPGMEVVFHTVGKLPFATAPISNLTKEIDVYSLDMGQYSVKLDQWGLGVGVDDLLIKQMPFFEFMDVAVMKLGDSFAETVNRMLKNVLVSGPNVMFAGDRTRSTLRKGVDVLDTDLITKAVAQLETNRTPRFEVYNGGPMGQGGRMERCYVCFCHPKQLVGIKFDPRWEAAHLWAKDGAQFEGVVGKWDRVIFISTDTLDNGAQLDTTRQDYAPELHNAAVGGTAPSDVYKAVLCGDQSFGLATGLSTDAGGAGVQIRRNILSGFGLVHQLAWYSIMNACGLHTNNWMVLETTV